MPGRTSTMANSANPTTRTGCVLVGSRATWLTAKYKDKSRLGTYPSYIRKTVKEPSRPTIRFTMGSLLTTQSGRFSGFAFIHNL